MRGDFNRHIDKERIRYETIHGRYKFGDENKAGISILDFAVMYNLIIANTHFREKIFNNI